MRKIAVSLVVMAFGLLAATAASASAATATCETSGTIKLSPGLSNTAQVQNVSIKGTLSHCSGEESSVTGGKYVAHFKTAEPVTCAVLTGAGAPEAESNIVLKWSPKGQGNSMGTFTLPVTEVPGASLGGLVESGLFAGASISGTVSETYTGGAKCGVSEGKKAKKVEKGTFSGSLTV
jgi:hypothetical protein